MEKSRRQFIKKTTLATGLVFNPFENECRIIEIQYGQETSEEDIERLEFYKGNNE